MRLKRLTLKNFRSFEFAELEFPSSGGILLQGDSGAGKTSILLGISYALDILPDGFSGSKLQNWRTDDKMQVILEIESNQELIVLARGHQNYIQTATEKISGAKAYAEALPRILGLPKNILASMVYRPQRQPGMFLSMTALEKTKFLTEVLDLQVIEEEIDKSKTLQSGLTADLQQIDSKLSVLSSISVPVAPTWINEEVLRDEVADATAAEKVSNASVEEAKVAIENALNDIRAANDAAKEDATKNAEKARSMLDSMRAKLFESLDKNKQIQSAAAALQAKIAQKSSVESRKNKVLADLEILNQAKCSTCGQTWHDNQSEKDSAQRKIQEFDRILESIAAAEIELLQKKQELVDSSVAVDELKTKIANADTVTSSLIAKLNALQSPMAPQMLQEELQKRLQVLRNVTEKTAKARRALESAELQNKIQNANYQESLKKYEIHSQQAKELTSKREVVASALNAEKDFCLLVGKEGFLNTFFADVLVDLSVRVNAMLKTLPNVTGVSLNFVTEAVKSGNKSIGVNLTVDGHEAEVSSGLSGGQQAVVEQVVDLALGEVLQNRTGKAPKFLMLDETLYGFGHSTKEAVMNVLGRFAADKLVLVVDHSSEIKEMFSKVIDVRSEDGVSSIA